MRHLWPKKSINSLTASLDIGWIISVFWNSNCSPPLQSWSTCLYNPSLSFTPLSFSETPFQLFEPSDLQMRAGLQRVWPWPSVVLLTQNKSYLSSFQWLGTDLKYRSMFPVIKLKVSSCFPGCYSLLCQLLVEQSQIPEVLAFSNDPPLPSPHKRYFVLQIT